MKTISLILIVMLVGITTASASELNIEQLLRSTAESTTYSAVGADEAGSHAISNSEEDSVNTFATSGVTTFGDNTFAGAFSQGEGDDLSLGSYIHLEGYNLYGEGEAYVTGDEVDTESSANADSGDGYNSIDIVQIANGIGDASGYTWAFGWE